MNSTIENDPPNYDTIFLTQMTSTSEPVLNKIKTSDSSILIKNNCIFFLSILAKIAFVISIIFILILTPVWSHIILDIQTNQISESRFNQSYTSCNCKIVNYVFNKDSNGVTTVFDVICPGQNDHNITVITNNFDYNSDVNYTCYQQKIDKNSVLLSKVKLANWNDISGFNLAKAGYIISMINTLPLIGGIAVIGNSDFGFDIHDKIGLVAANFFTYFIFWGIFCLIFGGIFCLIIGGIDIAFKKPINNV